MTQVLLALTSPLVAIAITVWGFRRQDRASMLRMLFEVQERYLAPPVREGRRIIHTKIAATSGGVTDCTREELSVVGYALAVMNTIAISVESGALDAGMLRGSLGRSYMQAVEAAAPFIDHVEKVRGFRPYPYAEKLAASFRQSAPPALIVGISGLG
ncbi:MAG: hypothetical protein HOV87_19780 [Catenulispora sp.]|nr:hypothetical protein [Catenulispora sp.]